MQHQASYGAAVDWVIRYSYDYENRLVRRRMDANGDGDYEQKRVFVYDGNQVVLDFQHTGAGDVAASDLRQRYLWGPAVDQILAEEEVDNGTDDLVQWTLTDHLNTVRDIAKYDPGTDTTTVVNHLVYDAFGKVTSESNPAVDSRFLFTARPFDEDTGLQNNLHRWYDPAVGRWLSEDPIGFDAGETNCYRYAWNRALTLTDSDGQFPVVAVGAGVVAVGILIVVLPDWGTDWLTEAQAHQVWLMTQRLLRCAECTGDSAIATNLKSMTVTGIFEKGTLESDDISETRNGRFFGWSNRTILSADFFERDCTSQMRTLLHESYHAGTEDWTETESYAYTDRAWDAVKKACPGLCS